MKSLILSIALFVFFIDSVAYADVSVKGYTRRDGTYVRPHMRSNPDRSFSNNWSTLGNVNPYTGRLGTKTTPAYTPNTNVYTYSKDYSTKSQNYNEVPSGLVNQNSTGTLIENRTSNSKFPSVGKNFLKINGINWKLFSSNSSDAIYIAQTGKEFYGDGLPVVTLMFTGVMKTNGRPTWLGQRFTKIKVNCSNYKAALIADAVVNSRGTIIKNSVLIETDNFVWLSLGDFVDQSKFLRESKVCN